LWFSFFGSGEDEVVELVDGHRQSVLVCMERLVLMTAHRRVHQNEDGEG
jgi:hypothetical protein